MTSFRDHALSGSAGLLRGFRFDEAAAADERLQRERPEDLAAIDQLAATIAEQRR